MWRTVQIRLLFILTFAKKGILDFMCVDSVKQLLSCTEWRWRSVSVPWQSWLTTTVCGFPSV